MPVASPNCSLTSDYLSSATSFWGNRTSVLALFRKIRFFFTPPLQSILSSEFCVLSSLVRVPCSESRITKRPQSHFRTVRRMRTGPNPVCNDAAHAQR
jgi:hypothetical protein